MSGVDVLISPLGTVGGGLTVTVVGGVHWVGGAWGRRFPDGKLPPLG
ncbi:hypothetical protein SAMN04487818_11128 [Actinokineospora terrae]|uniref:Uncharacterized protein n=1 Tax=Actinokineospora terrae TaxID=155974 RepID=A0A1H9WNS2_9PSEU|nr:hypothetical protein SAMN04487818_11128 [Actinokineospora terrae]